MSKNENKKIEETKVAEEVTEEVSEVVETPVETEVTEAVEETEDTKFPEPEMVERITGTVTGCARLRVRKKPSADAKVVCEIKESSTVVIDKEGSTKDFYKVCTEAGIEGFCMKQYIATKQ